MAVTATPPSSSALVTGLTSSAVRTRSPMTMTAPLPAAANAAQPPSARLGFTSTPETVTCRSERGMLKRTTPPGSVLPSNPNTCCTGFQSGALPAAAASNIATIMCSSSCALSKRRLTSFTADRLLGRGRQVVELDDRVGFGPHPELARVHECAVVAVDHQLAVEEDLNAVAGHLHRQLMPDAGGGLAVPTCEALASTRDHPIKVDVVLKSVGEGDVIVVLILQPPDDPAALITIHRHRLAFDRQTQVLQLGAGIGDGKTIVRFVAVGMREDVLAAGRVAHRQHDPIARLALSGERELESIGRVPGSIRIEIERRHRLLLPERGQRSNRQDPGLHDSCPRRLRLKYS